MRSVDHRAVRLREACGRLLAALALGLAAASSSAQDFNAGDIHIRHPYATPTPPGAKVGAAYFGALQNKGARADRLLRASTSAAGRVELHSGDVGADGVMRMRELDSLPLAPGATLELKPGQGNHLMLMDLKKPLKEGDVFPLTLEFEHGGAVQVQVLVQKPRTGGSHMDGHKH